MVVANQLDNLVVDKWDKKVVVVDIIIPSDSYIRKMEHKKMRNTEG